eukprot:617722-Heterocapsa_arctica.AAC.1
MAINGLAETHHRIVILGRHSVSFKPRLGPPLLRQPEPLARLGSSVRIVALQRCLQIRRRGVPHGGA